MTEAGGHGRTQVLLAVLSVGAVALASLTHFRWRSSRFLEHAKKKCQTVIRKKRLQISVVNSADELMAVAPAFWRSIRMSRIVGFDCEWVARGNTEPIALMQISSHLGHCVLLRLCKMGNIPPTVQDLLSDDKILKLGVGVLGDAGRLRRDFGLSVRGCLDVRHLVDCHKDKDKLRKKMGLAGLSEELLNVTLDKDFRVKCSNWAAPALSQRQIDYAALDAFISVPIFCDLLNDVYRKSLQGKFFPFSSSESWDIIHDIVEPYVDLHFKDRGHPGGYVSEETVTVSTTVTYKAPVLKDKKTGFTPRKGPLYSNCFMQAPDGEVLATCDSKKAMWYLSKGIAEKVSDDPLTVRLKFEPSGRPVGECDKYYQTPKDNCCVVCGKAESYVRKNVVPQEYRKHFPDVMKQHQSHDVLLLCTVCHRISNSHDLVLRLMLAEECDAPIGTEENVKVKEDFELKKVVSAARALTSPKANIPPPRAAELQSFIKSYYEVEEVTEEVLQRALKLEPRVINEAYVPHGIKVVTYYIEQKSGLVHLERKWREHFLETMKPRFLPALWSVDHNKERLDNRIVQKRVDLVDYTIAVKGKMEVEVRC